MFLKLLTITKGSSVIREIEFRKGINLIVDESEGKITGNNVGKTTVLKLIDFCFGANKNIIWEDPENRKQVYTLVRDFLVNNKVLITLCLTEDFDRPDAGEIVIERNFLSKTQEIIRRINGVDYIEDDFKAKLKEIFFPDHKAGKPSFRQIISHNIRYSDLSITNTLKTLDQYTPDVEYEALYLFLLGCEFTQGDSKQAWIEKIRQENTFKRRIERDQTKSAYEATLSLIDNEIDDLNYKKSILNINENFEADLNQLNQLKYRINKLSSEISKLQIRKELILETQHDLESGKSDIDVRQLKQIYEQATGILGNLQKSFEDLVRYHNQMISEKIRFVTGELPLLEEKIRAKRSELKPLLDEESTLANAVSQSDSFDDLESLIDALNEKYRLKGEYENIIQQLEEVESNLRNYNESLQQIDDELFSGDFETTLKNQLNKFNKHFASVSQWLYNEQYALKYDIAAGKNGQRIYKFSTFTPFGPNIASGKKQGEISSFDIAYIFFADEENIPCMHFILNDKKELMHDNQLVRIARLVNKNGNIQFVASILKDKLPAELNNPAYFIVRLSEDDKLFRIEK
ncbi:MAG: DUF2326 domain-containing protein [Syntrophomonas sp.]